MSDNEKYILDRKVELSKRKSASDYIRTLILFGFVYDVDYSYLRQYNETLGKISGNLNQIAKRINSTGNVYEKDMAEVKAIMDEVWRTQKAMLERIRAEKQRLIKEGKIKKDKHESVIFRRDMKKPRHSLSSSSARSTARGRATSGSSTPMAS